LSNEKFNPSLDAIPRKPSETLSKPGQIPRKPSETSRKEKGAKVKVWNITDNFGQPGQVRLDREGRLEVKSCGCRLWRLIRYIDISLFSAKDVKKAIKATEGISEVKSQRG